MTDEQASEWFYKNRKENLMTHNWPECGPGSINVEELYQAFKMRFMYEFVDEMKKP
jgi:hypothetical protein